MSFTDLRPYFRARIKTVDANLVEWRDGFNDENIPSTVVGKRAFHIEIGRFRAVTVAQRCHEMQGKALIKLFFDGTKDPQKAIDDIIAKGQAILVECLKAKNRATQPSIKNLLLVNFDPSPFSPSNDNIIKLSLEFDVTLFLNIEGA